MTRFNKNQILLLISAFIVVSTLLAYEPIRHNGFINYDDDVYVTNNSNITGGITWPGIKWAFTKPYAANWHPLTWLSHMVDCELFGLNPLGHHLVSVLFHIANALLLFWILNNLTGAIWPGAFVAAVFALHPLQVESVAWAAERKTVLSGLFWFLTIAVYSWYTKRGGIGRYIAVLGTYALCIMTKPVVVTLPLVLLLLDYWPLERVKKVSGVKLITEKIPLLALSIILCVITFVSQQSGEAVVSLERISLGGRIANMFMTYISYIGKTIWPSGLAVFYPHPRINLTDATVISCVLLFVLITALLIHTGRRRKYAATGWLWYLGTLVPVVGLLQVGSQAMANRYMYIPIVGLVIPVAWAAKEHVAKLPRWRVVWSLLGTGVLLSAVIVTRTQVRHWQNSMTVFEYALKATQNNGPAENSYGCALAEAGRVSEAELHFANAVRINPASFGARNNLGNAFVKQGKYNEAIACFNGILQQNENSAEARYNLAVALGVQKKYDEAIKNLAKVLSVDPNYPDARNKMGLALLATDRIEEAVACFNELLQQNENSAEAHYNLAVALCVQKKYDEAVKHLTKVLELDPEYPNARNSMASAQLSAGRAEEAIGYRNESLQTNKDRAEVYAGIGTAYIQLGKYEAALQNLSRAIELKPDYIEALNDMAWVLATVDDVSVQDANRAISYAERACELTGYKEANLLDTLAAAYAASGRFNDAITTAGQAVEAAKTNGKEDLANEIQNSIKLYQTGQRKRQK